MGHARKTLVLLSQDETLEDQLEELKVQVSLLSKKNTRLTRSLAKANETCHRLSDEVVKLSSVNSTLQDKLNQFTT